MLDGLAEILFYACVPLAVAAIFVVIVWIVQLRLIQRRQWADLPRRVVLYRGPLSVALLVMFMGLGLTLHIAFTSKKDLRIEAQKHLEDQTDRLESEIKVRMTDMGHLLDGVRGLLLAQSETSPAEFSAYVNARELFEAYPGLGGVGYISRVARSKAVKWEALQRRQGRFAFHIHPTGAQADLFVIQYMEPANRNQDDLGLDIGTELVTRAAAEASMRSGKPILTRRIALQQGDRKSPVFQYLLPVYQALPIPASEEQRVQSLRGWAYIPVVFSDLLAKSMALENRGVSFQLFDSPDLAAGSLLFDSARPNAGARQDASLPVFQSTYSRLRPIELMDQVFYLRTVDSPAFEASLHSRDYLNDVAKGSGLSVLVAMVLWLLMVGRARAIDMARDITSELERMAMVAQRTSNGVFFTDIEWRITWVNEGFTRLSGYSAQEACGRKPSELLHSPMADASVPQTIDQLAEAGQRVEIRVLQRNKQGQDYWVNLEVLPIHASNGRISGYLSVESDISEEVRAKAALLVEKERAENILSGTNVGTWESNLITGEERWNDRWSAMLGFAREEVLPSRDGFWRQRVVATDLARLDLALEDCIAGRIDNYSCEVRALHKDGNLMWILSRAKVMSWASDGHAEWIGGIHTDITESKQVELSLRDMEAFLDRAGRIAGVGAWQFDLQSRELVFSAQTCVIHGMAPDFRPTEEVALSFYPQDARQRLREAMLRAEFDGTPWDMVLDFRNAQGQQMWVRIFGELNTDDNGLKRLVGAFQDVTKDRLAQIEVERSSSLLRGALEAINEAFVLFDPQDRLVFCNDKYRAIYATSADLIVEGASFESILRGAVGRDQYVEALGRAHIWIGETMAAHRAGNVSREQSLKDGRWLKVVERRMPDGHTVGFHVDITELKLATAEAERISAKRGAEQRRMQTILEGTHVGTWEWNVQTGESIYSEQYVAMLGYTLAELEPLGYETWERLVHPEDLVASAIKVQEHLRGQQPEYEIEVRMRHKLGHWIWVLAKGKLVSRMEDGRPLWIYGTHMEITERKHAELQLAQTTATLQNVLDSATAVGIMTLSLDHSIDVFNKGAENLLGFTADELTGRKTAQGLFDETAMAALLETLELVWGRKPEMHEVFEQVVNTREEQEWILMRKNGSRFNARLIFSPMCDAHGTLVGNLCVIYDISRQKEYETSLREAMRLAEQSSVAKSQFLANMSHEIRTPMNAILGMLQLLRNTALSGSQRDYAEKAAGAARSLLGLLNDILDFSKVEAGKMQLDPEPFLLESLLSDLSVILSSNLGAKNVDLLFDIDPAIPRELIGDAMRIKQILINLGGNAVKFTESGEVVIRWSLLARTPERVKLAVAVIDSGIGIAPENQARIFNAFTQAEANTTRRFGGTGLGLVISTRLIQLMGGQLELKSAVGQGSTFSFTVELAVADVSQNVQVTGVPRQADMPVVRAALVDDSAQALASSTAMMQSLGWQVMPASSGPQALELIKVALDTQQPLPDVLFVDCHMPGMDGWETMRKLRQLFGSGAPPLIVMLSRQSREALEQRIDLELGMINGLMVRPFTPSMFERTLALARAGSSGLESPSAKRTQRLAGMHVLLVEDNHINQQVAQELLHAEGAIVTLADNGALGVEAVRRADPAFDAVLMDLQMPVMDGIRATQLLRTDARFDALPVIAMTANAMQSDRDECLAAGMNDHIGKPFELNRLVQTLIQHTHWQGSAVSASVPAQLEPAPLGPWPEGIDVEAALARMGGNRGLLQRSITAYVKEAKLLPQRLEESQAAGDMAQVKRDLHAFKGLSATIGVQQLSELAAHAEKLAQSPKSAEAFQKLKAQLSEHLGQIYPLLEEVASRLAPAPTISEYTHGLDQSTYLQFQELLKALQTSDMVAMELHSNLRSQLDESLAEALAPLDAAISDLEFEAAALACEKLLRQFGNH